MRGVAWNWTGSGLLIAAQIISTALTARLVSPAEFGLYATAQIASSLGGYFCLTAVGQGLQRRSQLGSKTVGTAVTLALTSSLIVSSCLWFGGALWANAWGLPDAAWVVRVAGVTLFLQVGATVPIAMLRRTLRFGRATVIETSAGVTAMGLGVLLAFQFHSAMALAVGQLGGAALLLAAALASGKTQMTPSYDRAEARELFVFASQVGGLGFLDYLTVSMPAWFIARTFGATTLGWYSRASLMAELPASYSMTSIYKVIYPLYGRIRDDISRVKALLSESLSLATGFLWPPFGVVAGGAPLLVRVLLGPKWADAATLFALLCLGICAAIPSGLLTNYAEAMGWMRLIAVRQVALLGGVIGALVIAYMLHLDIESLLLLYAGVLWLTYVFTLAPFVRNGLLDIRSLAETQLIHGALGGLCFVAAFGSVRLTATSSLVVQLATLGATTIVSFASLLALRSWFPAGQVLATRLRQTEAPVGAWRWLRAFLKAEGVSE